MYYVAIDLGGMSAKAALVDDSGKKYADLRCKTSASDSPEQTAENLANLAKDVAFSANVSYEEICAIGIGSPGIIDSEQGIVVNWTNFQWKNVPLAQLIRAHFDVPVFVLNDANAAALGENYLGAGSAYRSMVLLTLGTGVGSGIVIDGKIFEGNLGAGGEIGHEVIHFGGEKCSCGRRGCFEAYASATALIRQTKRAMERHPESTLWRICGGDLNAVSGITPFDGRKEGDATAKKVVNSYIRYLAEGVTNVINIFRPQAVILGGGVCGQGDTLLNPLKKLVYRMMYGGNGYASVEIATAKLGNEAGIYGAAKFAMDELKKKGD